MPFIIFFHETLISLCLSLERPFSSFMSFFSKRKVSECEVEAEQLEEEFVRIFTYFSIYIQDGLPIYSAFQELLKYASPTMKERLKDLT
jgi:hypothetical protein